MDKNELLWTIFREQDCTQREFATRVKMDRATNISLWLSFHQEISFEKLRKIAEVFGYTLETTLKKK